MVSHGKLSVSGAVDLANNMVDDGTIHKAVHAFASLGCSGTYPSKCERDLFRWLSSLFGFRLQPYIVPMKLQETRRKEHVFQFVFITSHFL